MATPSRTWHWADSLKDLALGRLLEEPLNLEGPRRTPQTRPAHFQKTRTKESNYKTESTSRRLV